MINKPSDLKNWAYETIRKMILNLEIDAGEQLHIEALSEKLGISRTPIREALLKLESEGLARSESRVGFFVQGITKKSLNELFELRELLESYAAERTAASIEKRDIDYLENLQKQSIRAVKSRNLTKFMETEISLHGLIIDKSKNLRLIKMVESIQDLTYRERALSLKSENNVMQSIKEHQRIIDSLKRKDAKLAGRMMREHISAVKERLIQFLSLPEDPSKDNKNNR